MKKLLVLIVKCFLLCMLHSLIVLAMYKIAGPDNMPWLFRILVCYGMCYLLHVNEGGVFSGTFVRVSLEGERSGKIFDRMGLLTPLFSTKEGKRVYLLLSLPCYLLLDWLLYG